MRKPDASLTLTLYHTPRKGNPRFHQSAAQTATPVLQGWAGKGLKKYYFTTICDKIIVMEL